MDELKKLYDKRDIFTEYNIAVPESLQQQIAQAESALLRSTEDLIIDNLPTEIDCPAFSHFVIAVEYVDGHISRVGSSTAIDIAEYFQNVHKFAASETDATGESGVEDEVPLESKAKRGSSIGFAVKFADGKVIKHTTAQRTMIEALRYMGLERASKFRGETFKGFPLIGREKRIVGSATWQKNVDGWWIYTIMENRRAVKCIEGVAKMLNIHLDVVWDDDTVQTQQAEKPKGKRQNFSLNGGPAAPKNRTVFNAVCNLLNEIPTATFRDICEFFPKQLQGSYGVVASLEEIEARRERNRTEDARWFLEPEEILTSADGIHFAVCNEWGNNFADFRAHVEKEFNWVIEEV